MQPGFFLILHCYVFKFCYLDISKKICLDQSPVGHPSKSPNVIHTLLPKERLHQHPISSMRSFLAFCVAFARQPCPAGLSRWQLPAVPPRMTLQKSSLLFHWSMQQRQKDQELRQQASSRTSCHCSLLLWSIRRTAPLEHQL